MKLASATLNSRVSSPANRRRGRAGTIVLQLVRRMLMGSRTSDGLGRTHPGALSQRRVAAQHDWGCVPGQSNAPVPTVISLLPLSCLARDGADAEANVSSFQARFSEHK